MRAVFDHSQEEAKNIRTFFFVPEKPVEFTAGQYAEWTLQHHKPDKRGIKRWFTISSSPNSDFVTITTRFAGDDKTSSFKRALFEMQPGNEILMSAPMGDFVLPKLIQTPLLFVAAGVGITPFHSILSWLAETGEQRPIKFIYAVRSEEDIIFEATFDKLGIKPIVVVSDPSPAWGGERGQLRAELIMGLGQPDKDSLVYVSGPEALVELLEKDLPKAGLKKDQFVGDYFPNYQNY